MKFSYTAIWNDTVGMLRANASLLAALAGAFIFLPALLTAYFLPQPEPTGINEMIRQFREYFAANWPWVLLGGLAGMVGAIAILQLLLGRAGRTVGEIIAAAFALLPFYFLATLLSNLLLVIGLLCLIVPGLYLIGRLAPIGPVVVAESRRNPVDAIKRAFDLTKGRGWAVAGLFLLVAVAGGLISLAVNAVLGIPFALLGGDGVGRLLAMVVHALTGAILTTVLIVLAAAIYRALGHRDSAAAAVD